MEGELAERQPSGGGDGEFVDDVDAVDVEEGEDEGQGDELAQAARAGIRLLEENAQLQDEVQHLQTQIAHAESEKIALTRLLEERDQRVDKLTTHLRESIRENQSLNLELAQTKQRVEGYQQLLQAQAATASTVQRSPGKQQRQAIAPRTVKTDTEIASASNSSKPTTPKSRPGRVLINEQASHDGRSQTRLVCSVSASSHPEQQREEFVSDSDSSNNLPMAATPALNQSISALKGAEAKIAEEQHRNAVLKMELSSAHKHISELKTHQSRLQQIDIDLEAARAQITELEQQLEAAHEERAEERELIHSLRSTIEVYQTLDHPLRNGSIRFSGSSKDGLKRRSSGTRITSALDVTSGAGTDLADPRQDVLQHRRRSDGCVVPFTSMATMENPQSVFPIVGDRYNLRDENDRLVSELDHLSKQVLSMKLQGGFANVVKAVATQDRPSSTDDETGQPERQQCIVGPVGLGSSSRIRQSEQHLAILQDLLKRFRSQWKHERNARRAAECEKTQLLGRMEKMQALLGRQCASCRQVDTNVLADDFAPWDVSSPVYKAFFDGAAERESNEEQGEALESVCFAILQRLIESWTRDSGKRMQLHDWLTNAIRGTGKEKPLYLFDLSSEVATGFQALMVPILSEKFGVGVQVEKRLRHVITTDLKLQVVDRSPDKAKACQHRIGRSLNWLSDADSAWVERTEGVGDFVCRGRTN